MTPEQAVSYLRARGLSDPEIAARIVGPNRVRQLDRMEAQRRDAADLVRDAVPTEQAIRTLRRLWGVSRRTAFSLLKAARVSGLSDLTD